MQKIYFALIMIIITSFEKYEMIYKQIVILI